MGNFFLLNLLLAVISIRFGEAKAEEQEQAIDGDEKEYLNMKGDIALIFPEVDSLKRVRDFADGVELAKMKLKGEEKFIHFSKVEMMRTKKDGTGRAPNSAIINAFLKTLRIENVKEYSEDTFPMARHRKSNQFLSQDIKDAIHF